MKIKNSQFDVHTINKYTVPRALLVNVLNCYYVESSFQKAINLQCYYELILVLRRIVVLQPQKIKSVRDNMWHTRALTV